MTDPESQFNHGTPQLEHGTPQVEVEIEEEVDEIHGTPQTAPHGTPQAEDRE